jgi:glycosyltransferase involved in cell wall biosynthesis
VHHIHRDHYAREMGRAGRVAALLLETLPLRLLYRRSRFLTISHASARDIARHGIRPERIEVGYIGVELDAFAPRPEARSATPTILYLGRLKRYKRIEVLLGALDRTPEAVLDIAGDGDHRPALEAEIARRGLTDRVRLHGHVTEDRKRELYQEAWVNATASSAEGWALSVMEAAACGTPTVAMAVGGIQESVDDGRTGLLARDADELAERIHLILSDPELRDSLGAAALERAHAFTWDATARRTLEVLEAQVAEGRELGEGGHGDAAGALADPVDRSRV